MGPRVCVEPEEFIEIANKSKELIIKGPKVALQGMTYVTRFGGYYYYTVSKRPLSLSRECQIREAKKILL